MDRSSTHRDTLGVFMLIVLKIGGDLLKNGLPENLVKDLISLNIKHKFVLVHGGGDVVTEISTTLGHQPKFVTSPEGIRSRYTDQEESKIFTMVMAGLINKRIVTQLGSQGMLTAGISGLDANLMKASRKKKLIIINEKGRKQLIEGGYTGKIEEIKPKIIKLLLESDITPIIAPVAMSEEYEPLNVDGDRVAAKIASTLQADYLILLTDVKGIILKGKLVEKLTVSNAKELIKDLGPGMKTKLHAAINAVENGIEQVIISSGASKYPVKWSLEHKKCTVIMK